MSDVFFKDPKHEQQQLLRNKKPRTMDRKRKKDREEEEKEKPKVVMLLQAAFTEI
jgi:hypothetical protein